MLALAGCSYMGARVPDKPPAPKHCPEGVVIADAFFTGQAVIGAVVIAADLLNPNRRSSQADLVYFVAIPAVAISLVLHGTSLIYGLDARARCQRLQDETAKQAEADRHKPPPPRPDIVGDKPMHCAVTTADVGRCFADEATCKAEAEQGGGSCEARNTAWCFDTQGILDRKPDTICAASAADCDARRQPLTVDRTQIVTTCARYTVKATQQPASGSAQ